MPVPEVLLFIHTDGSVCLYIHYKLGVMQMHKGLDNSKKFYRIVTCAIVAMGIVASSSVASATQRPSNKSKNSLVVVAPLEPVSMNPVKQANSFGNFWQNVTEAVVGLDANFNITKNNLVVGWNQTVPGTWRLNLRPKIKFTNGEPWDATALAFTLTTYRDTVGAPMRSYLTKLTSTSVVSPTVLDVVFSAADSSIPFVLSSIRALPPVYYAQVGHDGFGLNPIGTGPFKFTNWSRGVELNLVRNDKYWGEKAKIKNLKFVFATDSNLRAGLLLTGGADVALGLPIPRIDELTNKKTTVVLRPDRKQLALFFEGQKTELKDLDLRKAATLAINIDTLTKTVMLDKGGSANCSLLTTLLSKPGKASCAKQDMTAAQALVAKYKNPSITFNYSPARSPYEDAMAQAIAGQLRTAGFTVNLVQHEYSAMTTAMVLQKLEGIVMYAIVPVFPHPNVYAQGFITPTSITKNCLAPGMADLAAQALAAATPLAADAIYAQMEKISINEQYCMLPLFNVIENWGMSTGIGGFIAPPATVVDWSKVFWK